MVNQYFKTMATVATRMQDCFIVPFGEWEKNPRLQAKTIVDLRYGEHYRKSSHTVYDIKYHIVWITKYRKPILRADIAQRARDLIRAICRANDVEIIKGHVSRDHVHIFVAVPPHLSVNQLVKSIKGKTSRKMLMEFKTLSRAFWGRHMWARGYFAASSGNVKDEVIMKYTEQQSLEPPDGDFKTDDDP